MFEHFVKKNGDVTRVLFIYLLLNKYDLRKIKKAIVHYDTPANSTAQTEIVYAETTEAIDIEKIDKEFEKIIVPTICSMTTFQIYTNINEIIRYTPENPDKAMYIDDLDIISPFMIIEKNMLVTTFVAKPVNQATHGLSVFVEYVLTGKCLVGKWHIEYTESSREFIVKYNEETLYKAKEFDKTSTFGLVLYIIKKTCASLAEEGKWEVAENYKIDRYSRIER